MNPTASCSTSLGESGEGWPVGFGDKTLLLRDMGAATSGTKKRAWEGGHHLIDPRTGLGVTGRHIVTVIADDGALADAAATALSVLGPDRSVHFRERIPGALVSFRVLP